MFFSEFEFFGRQYRPSEEASPLAHEPFSNDLLLTVFQFRKRVKGLFGAIDADTRYERRADAPVAPAPREQPPK